MVRKPVVAGHFYQSSAGALRREVGEYLSSTSERVPAIGIVSPHAGLMYSGPVAGAVYSRVVLPSTIILIGPNHTGLGAPVSIMTSGSWETPLGSVEIDETMARAVLSGSPRMREDTLAHLREHSLEVQLPFIQHLKPDFKIIPIQMLDVRLGVCQEVGKAIAHAIAEHESAIRTPDESTLVQASQSTTHSVLIVASSDMTHYEPARVAKEKDEKAIQYILDIDPEGLHRTVRDLGITMCGFGPVVAMLTACKELGATRAELVKYANSGDVSGDFDQVVGYAGILIV